MYGTDGHETWRLGAESRLDKPRDSLVRDGVTRRVRVFFFISRRPPRFARVLPHLSDGSAVSLSHVNKRHWTGNHEEERPRDSAERNSDLGAQRDLDRRRRRAATAVSRGKEEIFRQLVHCGERYFSVYAN